MIKIALFLALSLLSALLYRLGGIGKPFNTKIRDLGVPFLAYLLLLILRPPSHTFGYVLLFLSWGASFGAMTTYFSFICEPKDDVNWIEWAITGFVYGLSAFLLCYYGIHTYAILARSFVLTVLIPLWSCNIGDVNIEEGGRGFLFTATIPLLLI